MATIDIIILIIVGAGAIVGFMKGFIRQLASILGLIVGLMAAKALYASLAAKLCPAVTDSMTVAQVLAFIMIWIEVAPASMEFSTSSFITEAGRCITSPAAIWLATESGSSFMMSLFIATNLRQKNGNPLLSTGDLIIRIGLKMLNSFETHV